MFVAYLCIANITNLQTNTLKHKYKGQTSKCINTTLIGFGVSPQNFFPDWLNIQ